MHSREVTTVPPESSEATAPLLKLEGIDKYYGTVHALKSVSLEIYPREIVGLIGDNGAGKSTLIKIISGVTPKNRGHIYWKGKEVNISSVKKARELGIETVHQDRAVVGVMSVARNIFLGREQVRRFGFFRMLNEDKMRKEAEKLARDLKLNIPSTDQEVRFCSGGEMQGVAISRAMYFKASLIILDEPTTALAVTGVQRVLNFIQRLKEQNISCVFVTHNLHDVYSVADRFVVMLRGAVAANLRKQDVTVDDLINLQIVGSQPDAAQASSS
jgi:simple sugar transport system ATP-binding protein